MAYDQQIIDAIYARAKKVTDPSRRNRYLRAALQTGIVESGLRNLNYGDADSLGWRQERQQFYKDPLNVTASVDRFFDEAAKLDRGQHSWELAADVQRPAAQYRGRYKDVAREAASLLKGLGAGGGSPSSAPGVADPQVGLPSVADGGQAGDFTSLLGSLLSKPQQAAQPPMPIAAPQFSAAQALPQGFRPLTPTPQPAEQQDTLSATLSLLGSLRGQGATVQGADVPEPPAGGSSVPIATQVQNQRNGKVTLPKDGTNNWGVLDYVGQAGKYIQQTYGVKDIGGYRANDPYPDHPSRKALDLMVYKDREKGDMIASDLIRNYRQLKVRYIIWNQRIWHPGKGWRKMEDRGSPTQNHEDHVHALFK